MPLDPSIPWGSYNAAQDRRRLDMAQQQMEDERQWRAAQLQTQGADLDKIADRALLKKQMGQPLDPREQAGLDAWNAKQQMGLSTDMEGNIYPSKRSIYDIIGGAARPTGINPAAGKAGLPIGEFPSGTKAPAKGISIYDTSAEANGALDAIGDALPKPTADGSKPLTLAELQSMIPALDVKDLGTLPPEMGGSDLPQVPNPNRDQIPQPDTSGESPYRQKEAWNQTNNANADLKKTKLQNQVPGLKTRDGYVPSADDAKQTKEVAQAVDMLDSLLTDYQSALDKSPNPVAGSPEALQINQLRAQIGAQVKAMETLGAYDSGVQQLMNQMLGNPIIAGGTTMDFAANPIDSIMSTKTKADPATAKALNKSNIDAFRKYSREKLKSTAGARGFEAPQGGKAVSYQEYFK
ncbi:hypothetical protein [Methylobacterium sp. 1030]|uniref:hypothetical protein n=1 Tax=Methylobacterium sp. 1030 TaxID=3156404 RepID=UPI0033981A67